VSLNVTRFQSAEGGATSCYKFQVDDDPNTYVWFEFGDGAGSLHVTPRTGPFDPADPLADAEFSTLDDLLDARETTKLQWVRDLMAQFGERLAWTYAGQNLRKSGV